MKEAVNKWEYKVGINAIIANLCVRENVESSAKVTDASNNFLGKYFQVTFWT